MDNVWIMYGNIYFTLLLYGISYFTFYCAQVYVEAISCHKGILKLL